MREREGKELKRVMLQYKNAIATTSHNIFGEQSEDALKNIVND